MPDSVHHKNIQNSKVFIIVSFRINLGYYKSRQCASVCKKKKQKKTIHKYLKKNHLPGIIKIHRVKDCWNCSPSVCTQNFCFA